MTRGGRGGCELEDCRTGDGDTDTVGDDGVVDFIARMLPLGASLVIAGNLQATRGSGQKVR